MITPCRNYCSSSSVCIMRQMLVNLVSPMQALATACVACGPSQPAETKQATARVGEQLIFLVNPENDLEHIGTTGPVSVPVYTQIGTHQPPFDTVAFAGRSGTILSCPFLAHIAQPHTNWPQFILSLVTFFAICNEYDTCD